MPKVKKKSAARVSQERIHAFGYELLQRVEVDGKSLRLSYDPDMICLRCEASGMLVVNESPKTCVDHGYCVHMCLSQPWSCPKCDGRKVPEHTKWCPVAHPEARAVWVASMPALHAMLERLLPLATNVRELRATINAEITEVSE